LDKVLNVMIFACYLLYKGVMWISVTPNYYKAKGRKLSILMCWFHMNDATASHGTFKKSSVELNPS